MADAILIFVLRDRELTLRLNMILKVTYVVSCRVSIWKQFGIGTHTLKLRPQKTTQLWTAGASSVVLDPQIWFWSWMLERKRNSHIELHLKAAIESDCHLPACSSPAILSHILLQRSHAKTALWKHIPKHPSSWEAAARTTLVTVLSVAVFCVCWWWHSLCSLFWCDRSGQEGQRREAWLRPCGSPCTYLKTISIDFFLSPNFLLMTALKVLVSFFKSKLPKAKWPGDWTALEALLIIRGGEPNKLFREWKST